MAKFWRFYVNFIFMHFLPVLGDSSVREEHWPGMRDVLVACFVYLFLGKRRAKLKLETPGGGAGLSCEIKCDKTGSWESFLLCKNCNFEIKSSLQQSSSHHHRTGPGENGFVCSDRVISRAGFQFMGTRLIRAWNCLNYSRILLQ